MNESTCEILQAKKILESAGYRVTKINESWPPILYKLSKFDQSNLRRRLIRAGYDIENLSSTDIQLTSGRDTRIKNGMTIVVLGNRSKDIGVWVNGEIVVDPWIISTSCNMRDLSWKRILEMDPQTYYMAFDSEKAAAMNRKQRDRKESQKGTVNRYTPDTKPRYSTIDKSGYVIDPKKYVNMFAEMSIKNGAQILQNAKDVYVKLADKLDKINNDTLYTKYDSVMRGLISSFRYLSKYLDSYNKSVEKYKSMPDENEYKYDLAWQKKDVVDAIKDIREYMKSAKEFENLGEEGTDD